MKRRAGRRSAKRRAAARPTARASGPAPASSQPQEIKIALAVVQALKARIAHPKSRIAGAAQRALQGLLRDQPQLALEFGLDPPAPLGRKKGRTSIHFRQSAWILTAIREDLTREEILLALDREANKANKSWLARRERSARSFFDQPNVRDWAGNPYRRALQGLESAERKALILKRLGAIRKE